MRTSIDCRPTTCALLAFLVACGDASGAGPPDAAAAKVSADAALATTDAPSAAHGADAPASADLCPFHLDRAPQPIVYWSITNPPANDPRCTWTNGSPACKWTGWLWRQAASTPSAGNLPLVVVVHGSGTTQSSIYFCEQVKRLVDGGYVVFMPYMRGVGDNGSSAGGGWTNTGTYLQDWVDDRSPPPTPAKGVDLAFEYMTSEADNEIQLALTAMVAQRSGDNSKPLIDPTKIALMGHSYGGLLVTVAASRNLVPLPKATIDLSGGVLSWSSSPEYAIDMKDYAPLHKMPLYVHQMMNESPAEIADSTTTTFLDANGAGTGDVQMGIFGDADVAPDFQAKCDSGGIDTYTCHHGFFLAYPTQVDRWWPAAFDFLTRHGVE
jgi:pimeloyl-ACP methyl ester carboxylesterase